MISSPSKWNMRDSWDGGYSPVRSEYIQIIVIYEVAFSTPFPEDLLYHKYNQNSCNSIQVAGIIFRNFIF